MFRWLLLLTIAAIAFSQTLEVQALQISKDIQARHLPFGTILSPIYANADSSRIVAYTRCGDSAIWTGHYLAAESFRYAVTRTVDSLAAARLALRGIQMLADVTGTHQLLARCVLEVDSPLSAEPRKEEAAHGEYLGAFAGVNYYWIGHTSRDQYLGVFFGLSVAYDHLPEDRPLIRQVATKLIDRLLQDSWAVVMPDGSMSTVFWLRPDQQLSILQVGRQVNPEKFRKAYEELRENAVFIGAPISLEAREEHESYYKFNLDAIALYSLLRLEEESPRRAEYISTYRTFRSIIANHGNAFFNVIDRALAGSDPQRDAETIRMMWQWLGRPRRDFYVDLRTKYRACGSDRSCDPIPVPYRVRTDFLWQRSPFLLYGGGSGRIETPGIDFVLPYWMARYYGMTFDPIAVSAASGTATVSPDSIVSLLGAAMPVGNPQVMVLDKDGVKQPATVLFANSDQINFVVPAGITPGQITITVTTSEGVAAVTTSAIAQRVAPALFTANANGKGVAAATAFRVESDGSRVNVPVSNCLGPLSCRVEPIEISEERPVYVSFYGTGIRGLSTLAAVHLSADGTSLPIQYAGPQGEFPGLDQINVRLPISLRGRGEIDLMLSVDGIAANTVQIGIR